ncbi:MAG: HXXEE domain-containing protein, partial [Candidatus Hermodarchaeota archaeon]
MMNGLKIKNSFSNFSFKKAIWLAPIAYLVHLIEEASFGFYKWSNKYFNDNLTFGQWLLFNCILMGIYFLLIIIYNIWPNQATGLIVLTAFLTVQFHNAIFHLFWTIYLGVYSPGVISGLLLYIPFSCIYTLKAYKEHYLTKLSGILIFIISGFMMWIFFFVLGAIMIITYLIVSGIILVIYYIKNKQTLS